MQSPIFYGAVHLFFLNGKNEILLLKRRNTGFEDGKWSVVAGRIDGNEEVKSAAIREAFEEAGVKIKQQYLEVIGIMHRRDKSSKEWIDFFLTVHEWEGDISNKEPHKCEELRWFPLSELPENIIPYIKHALSQTRDSVWFESLGWGEEH
ncbi:NUDIX domain-containing protein [Cohnella sp. AR92]|uniref:NUDIX hydrolase n=1 Tax=Cohnella sp. AR92 TaxID=648716 RepID=UPI000F8E60B7|nr:NUDIX domain-containing protein [Cohnella sp. AR92]RUS46226.1 NUDIX domain-containing protein [Cohnella sp. AR92]